MSTRIIEAAIAVGLELPPEAAAVFEQAAAAAAGREQVGLERSKLGPRPLATKAVAAGADPLEAAEAELAWAQRDAVIAVAESACDGLAERTRFTALPAALRAASPELFEQVRSHVEALVEQVQPAVRALREYAPEFDGRHVAAHGSPAQIKAYQAAAELQAEYATWRRFWAELWAEATGATPAARQEAGYLRRRDPLRQQPDLLRLAAAGPEALAAALRTPASIASDEAAAEQAALAARREEVQPHRRRREGVGA